jgi:heme exporter protein D
MGCSECGILHTNGGGVGFVWDVVMVTVVEVVVTVVVVVVVAVVVMRMVAFVAGEFAGRLSW